MTTMTDVRIYSTDDGGEVAFVNGLLSLDGGIESAVFLSLFGGNEDDEGLSDTAKQWWGNIGEAEEFQFRSRTQALLRGLAANTANLKRLQEATSEDLTWFVSTGIATLVSTRVTLPAPKRVAIEVAIEIDGETQKYTFNKAWGDP